MAMVEVKIPIGANKLQEQDLFWYDPILKKMLKFHGKRLEFSYIKDPDLVKIGHTTPYRLVPKVIVGEKVRINTDSLSKLLKWFSDFKNYNDSDAEVISENKTSGIVLFEVSEEDLSDFCDELENNRFRYQVV